VFTNLSEVSAKQYNAVYVTYSVPPPIPTFLGDRRHFARDHVQFDPSGDEHEVEMNFRFLHEAIGVDWSENDTREYFLGNLVHSPTSARRVVIHAGSKGGNWSSKRWPYFEELVAFLASTGAEVVSVGVPEEYVPGTIDRTGLSIGDMADVVASARLVISNDSGVMNMANALGAPIVALFAPTNPVTRGPRRSHCHIVLAPTACAPCERTENDRLSNGTCRCIGFISIDRVMQAIQQLTRELEATPANKEHSAAQQVGTPIALSNPLEN
jgi:ADP-heptose:LPS heptosyltransferase